MGYIHHVKDGDAPTSPWVLYLKDDSILQEGDEALQLAHYQMFKGFLTLEDKQKVVLSLCTLYHRKEYLKGKNLKDITESICNHFKSDI